jgi:hypothetical protein
MMKYIWNKMQYAGLDDTVPETEYRTVLVLNQMCAALNVLMVFYVVLSLWLQRIELLVLTIAAIILLTTTLILNGYKKFTLAKFFCVGILMGCIVTTSYFTGLKAMGQYAFIGTAMIPLVLFHKRSTIFILLTLNIAAFYLVYFWLRDKPPLLELDADFYTIAYLISFPTLTIVIFVITYYFRRNNEAYQDKIMDQKRVIGEKNREMTESMEYARTIQRSVLPADTIMQQLLPGHFKLFIPKDIVSGDFYWAAQKDGMTYLAVCDSTGHGVPGAFMSLLNISFLNEALNARMLSTPSDILDHVRGRLIESLSHNGQRDGMDGILLRIDPAKKQLSYAAAYNAPLLVRNGILQSLPADKMPVGKGERAQPFTLHTIDLLVGDQLYFYTDGFADQFGGPKGKKFKYRQLHDHLLQHSRLPLERQEKELRSVFDKWRGNLEQVDDVCVLGIRI